MSDPDEKPIEPAPEGVDLLGTQARAAANTDAARRRYAIGPFGQAWLWTFSGILLATSLYRTVAGQALAATLPTAHGTVLRWITVFSGRNVTYVPKISFQVAGRAYEFVAGTAIGTMTGAPKAVTVSYVAFDPSTAMWNTGEWWAPFFDTYLMVTLILGLILFGVAIYQLRIRRYWDARTRAVATGAWFPWLVGLGILAVLVGGLWLLSGYITPASWFLPPDPNLIAAFIAALGAGMLASAPGARRRGVSLGRP